MRKFSSSDTLPDKKTETAAGTNVIDITKAADSARITVSAIG